jgi:hypothetical protein
MMMQRESQKPGSQGDTQTLALQQQLAALQRARRSGSQGEKT